MNGTEQTPRYCVYCRFCSSHQWTKDPCLDGWICRNCMPAYRAGVEAMRDAVKKKLSYGEFEYTFEIDDLAARLLEEKP